MSHALLKKLQVLRDKLELRRDDLSVSEAALADESRELQGRREQLELVNGQIASCTREMDELGVRGRAEKARQEEFAHEEEALRHTFSTILDHGLKELREERRRMLALAEAAEMNETELREVSVLFEDEEAVFRVTDPSYTFDELTSDACRFFELHPLDVVTVDDRDERWAGDASVRNKMLKYDNAYGRIFLKMREEEVEEEEMEDADNILQLLLRADEEPEEEDEEEDEIEALQAAQAMAGGGDAGKKKKKKKKFDRMQLYKELPMFLFFMVSGAAARRSSRTAQSTQNAAQQPQSARTSTQPLLTPFPPLPFHTHRSCSSCPSKCAATSVTVTIRSRRYAPSSWRRPLATSTRRPSRTSEISRRCGIGLRTSSSRVHTLRVCIMRTVKGRGRRVKAALSLRRVRSGR